MFSKIVPEKVQKLSRPSNLTGYSMWVRNIF